MSLFKSKSPVAGVVATGSITLISRATTLTGDIRFSGSLEIEGTIHGNIHADGENAQVRVCETGLVQGEIHAPRVIINGRVEGDVHVAGHLELAAKARVVGDVYYELIEMVMGAEVNGVLHHVPKAEAQPVTAQKAAAEAAVSDSAMAALSS
jgi:Integral membrane protein CcmA involved in cell shape determination